MEAATSSDRSAPERGPVRWTSLLVLAVGVIGALALSTAVRRAQEAELRREVDATAEAVRRLVLVRLDPALQALRSQVTLWSSHGARSEAQWIAEAERFLAAQPGFEAVVRSRPESGSTEAATGVGQRMLAELSSALGRERDRTALPGPRVIGPVRLADGGTAIGFEIPAADEHGPATVLAVMDPVRRMSPRLADIAPRGGLELVVNGVTVLQQGRRAPDRAGRFTRELEVRPSLGPAWTLRVAPTPEALAQALNRAPRYALGAGLLVALLLAAVVHLGQLAAARAQALRLAEARVERRVGEMARVEAEVRELNQGLEARVAERTAELREAVGELETFVYSVSHDLRSPLGAIVNFAAILAEDYGDKLDAAGRDHLGRISRSAQSAVSMMNALLAFSRTGRQELRRTWVDVDALVCTVVAELAHAGGTPKPQLSVDALPSAFADPSMLKVVFQNLISNALKFSRDGARPRIEILGREDERECEYAVIDDGIGFDMRHAPKLFRVFERLHAAEAYPGNGVGLAIVARAVSRHGGRISAEGAPGKGATFRFTLPKV